MSNEELQKVKLLLKDYVEKSSKSADIHWDPNLEKLSLTFNPYLSSEREHSARYFLMVAAIDRPEYVGRSETARALMIQIEKTMGTECFKRGQSNNFEKIVKELDPYLRLGPLNGKIPDILDLVNSFVEQNAKEGLIKYAFKFSKPEQMVQELASKIPYLGAEYSEHSWMYLRWMTRQFPDLHIFKNFSPKDLQIPLTHFVRNVACCFGICTETKPDWLHPEKINQERKQLTELAATSDMFPEDPTVVDYPLYVLGRWLNGEELSLDLLRKYLEFWQKVYDHIKKVPIEFDLLSRQESKFEKAIREQLERLDFIFEPEQNTFLFPKETGIPSYKPDFVLHKCSKKGKTVILEPHGPWTPREKRSYSLGGKTYSCFANPRNISAHEKKFVEKLRAFKANYGEMYYLLLILPSEVKDRVEWDYPDVADEICEGKDVPKLLYSIRRDNDTARALPR